MATSQYRLSGRSADRKPLRRRFRVDLAAPGSPVTGGVTVLAASKREALVAIRGHLDAHTATLSRSNTSGAILDLAVTSDTVKLSDVYEVASGPSLELFADQTRGVNLLEESVVIDLPHGAWIRVTRAGTSGSIESTLDEDVDEETESHDDADGANDDSNGDDDAGKEDLDDSDDVGDQDEARVAREDKLCYSAAIATLESLVLAQFCAGIDVSTPQYRSALVTTWDSLLNRYT